MNTTPVSSRLHIAIFGRRNAGKSSLINALTNQSIALVSEIPGTTTDPVSKTMELLPVGPVVIIDTPGLDDQGMLGMKRVQRAREVLNRTDLALLVIDGTADLSDYETMILREIKDKKLPVVGVVNKIDHPEYNSEKTDKWAKETGIKLVQTSALTGTGIEELKSAIIEKTPVEEGEKVLVGDLLQPGDMAVLVVPIDKAAPKGRLILPQQQVIRDILDHNAVSIVIKEDRIKETLASLRKKPAIVITDSQVFAKVAADTPEDISLTSFSILMARYKGDLAELVKGAKAIKNLKPGDKVLISEACTHHRQSDDIGTVKIPGWLQNTVGGKLDFTWTSGFSFPEKLQEYKLIIHCAGCMLNRREMLHRISCTRIKNLPIVNYGVLIAYLHGILPRSLRPFPEAETVLID